MSRRLVVVIVLAGALAALLLWRFSAGPDRAPESPDRRIAAVSDAPGTPGLGNPTAERVPPVTVRLSGSVIAVDGSTVIGATVTALPLEGPESTEAPWATTDEDGAFSLDLPRGAHALLARREGTGAGWLPIVRAPADGVVIRLGPPAVLSGTVATREGTPVPAARIGIDASPSWREMGQATGLLDRLRPRGSIFFEATTDRSGRFSVGPLAPGRYDVVVAADGFATRMRPGVTVPEADLGVVLDRGGTLEVALVVVGEERVESVRVEIGSAGVEREVVPSGAETPVRFEGLPEGEHALTAVAAGFLRTTVPVRIRWEPEPTTVRLLLVPGTPVSGTVTDEVTGQPIPDVTIEFGEVEQSRNGLGYGVDATTRTDAAGRYRVLLRPGQWVATPRGTGLEPPPERDGLFAGVFPVGREPVVRDLVLSPVPVVPVEAPPDRFPSGAGVVRGRVVDEGGDAVAGVLVAVAGQSGSTGPDGRFVLEAVPPGEHAAKLAAPGFSPTISGPLTIRDGEVTAGGDLVLRRDAVRIRGLVSDSSGEPLPGVRVSAWFRFPDGQGYSIVTSTDVAGRYDMPGPALDAAEVSLTARRPGYLRERTRLEASPWTEWDVRLTRAGTVTGRVRFAGVAAPRVDVEGWSEDPTSRENFDISFDRETGVVLLTGLEPGPWRFRVSAPGYAASPEMTVEVAEGDRADLGEVVLEPGETVDDD